MNSHSNKLTKGAHSIMDKKNNFSPHIGLPSIMLILIVLCMVSFSILSLVSASSDLRLSQKVLQRSAAYYNACNAAEEDISKFDARLNDAYKKGASNQQELISELSGAKNADSYYENFTYYISDIQRLSVRLSVNYPSAYDECLYRIDEWRIVTDDSLEYDTSLHIPQ